MMSYNLGAIFGRAIRGRAGVYPKPLYADVAAESAENQSIDPAKDAVPGIANGKLVI
jgi:hypothetical protein